MYLLLIPYSFFNMLRDLIILCTVITCTAVVQITRIDKSILNFNLPVLQKAAVLCSVTFPELESSTLDWTEDIKSRLQYESVLFVALEHGEAVGVAEISLRAGTSSWSLIENVCVHPECRKLGIGALLVKRCVQDSIDVWHCDDVRLNIEDDNIGAKLFYAKLGFEVVPGSEGFGSAMMKLS